MVAIPVDVFAAWMLIFEILIASKAEERRMVSWYSAQFLSTEKSTVTSPQLIVLLRYVFPSAMLFSCIVILEGYGIQHEGLADSVRR